MKQFLHKTMSFLMAFVVLFSTLSFTIDMHYCGDRLVDTSLFGKAKGCGMELQQSKSQKDCSITKKNCCDEKQIVIEGQDELKLSLDNMTFDQQLFVATFIQTYVNLFEGLETNIVPFNGYPPPLIVKDIQQLDEVYLI
jgi:hypothetical protein